MGEDGESLGTQGVVTLVSGVFLLNLAVMAAGFGIVSGSAFLLGRSDLAGIFAAGTGFLLVLLTVLGVFRSLLVDLLSQLAS